MSFVSIKPVGGSADDAAAARGRVNDAETAVLVTNQTMATYSTHSAVICGSLYETVSNLPPEIRSTVPERFLSTSAAVPGHSAVPSEFRTTSAPTVVAPRRPLR